MSTPEFEEQCILLENRLLRRAIWLTSDKDKAKDLLQTTKLLAFSNITKYKDGTNFKAWIKTIMYNSFVSEYRKKNRRKKINLPMQKIPPNQDPVEDKFLLRDIQAIIEDLKKIYQVPFVLLYKGYSYQEISERLSLPLGTVKSRIYTARRILRTEVKKTIN